MYSQIEGYLRLLRRHRVGIPDYKDIIDVLKAVNEIDRVCGQISKAPNEEAATPKETTTERPSMSTAPIGYGSRLPVVTPRVVPTLDPSPPTPYLSPSTNIPPPTSHPCPGSNIPPPTL